MTDFIAARWQDILFRSYQHTSLVIQSVAVALIIALVIAIFAAQRPRGAALANALSSIGLTLPSLALLGLAIPLFGIGTVPSVALVVFYAVLPILRNAIVGLHTVDPSIIESARGQGMSKAAILFRIRLPLAWPIIMTGIRVATQMSMGVGAKAADGLGTRLGGDIY